jgi:hypothetical protein
MSWERCTDETENENRSLAFVPESHLFKKRRGVSGRETIPVTDRFLFCL